MRYYPLFLDINGRKCVVVGGGNVAERKVRRLFDCGARVEVVGLRLTPLLAAWRRQGRLVHHDGDYDGSVLGGASLVIGATDDAGVNARVAGDARALGIPVNIVDDPDHCDFILPAIVERGDLAIAISTGGRSPALAKRIREDLEGRYGPRYADLLEILGRLREKVIARRQPPEENRRCFEAVIASEFPGHVLAGRFADAQASILELTGIELEVKPK